MERGYAMSETREGGRKRGFDPLIVAAAAFFLMAVGLAAVPAFKSGAATLAGMLLLAGLAGVAFVGLIAFRNAAREAPAALRLRTVLWTGSLSNRGMTFRAKVSIERSTSTMSRARVRRGCGRLRPS